MPLLPIVTLWSCLLAAMLALPVADARAEPAPAGRILYFNPEISIDNFLVLEEKFNAFLAEKGKTRFTPASTIATFEKELSGKPDGAQLLLISSWYYKSLRDTTRLRPLLIGTRNGMTSQKKVLVVRKEEKDPGDGINIASATSQEFASQLLDEMAARSKTPLPKRFGILRVPKDLDALMSVAFGMADAALAAEHGWRHLRQINPTQFERLRMLAESREIPLPILAVNEARADRDAALADPLRAMNQSEKGETALRLLGLDGFRPPTPAEEQFLNQ
ncbi:MAG: PhnD/SsuA/transferrin family substrate-binding protein [Magnetococcales bacterium]|nr:PhnD/SsuA/transferrin family substrate-binding protein [Magnetococcales bacterium]